jgi:hypothetical protein
MITIKLLGPIQRAYNLDTICLDKSDLSISNIISYLRDRAVNPDLIEERNILIAVNGIQSSLIPRFDTWRLINFSAKSMTALQISFVKI